MDIFLLNNGKRLEIDFTSIDSLQSVSQPEWIEIGEQIRKWRKIAFSKLSGEELLKFSINTGK